MQSAEAVSMNMQLPILRRDPQSWLSQVFSAQAVARGGIVRRNVHWVEREIGRAEFMAAVRTRGYHLIENGGQFIVICNQSGLRVLC